MTARVAAIRPDDPVTLLYTSGTTGNPKGVLLTHRGVLYEVAAGERTGNITPGVRWVSYLPLAHIAERMFTIYLPLSTAGHVLLLPGRQAAGLGGRRGPADRVLRRAAGLGEDPGRDPGAARRRAGPGQAGRGGPQAMDVGRRYVESCQFGRTTPDELAAAFQQADQAVLGPIRALLGLGDAGIVSSAAAPLPPDVAAFFAGLGLQILDIYGMTETTGAFAFNTAAAFKMGTVGRPLPGIEVRIDRRRRDLHPRPAEHARAT